MFFLKPWSLPPEGKSADPCATVGCLGEGFSGESRPPWQRGGGGGAAHPSGHGAGERVLLPARTSKPQTLSSPPPAPPFSSGSRCAPSWSSHHAGTVAHSGLGVTDCYRRNWAPGPRSSGWKTSSAALCGERSHPAEARPGPGPVPKPCRLASVRPSPLRAGALEQCLVLAQP